MRDFFKGWKREAGLLTLGLACALATARASDDVEESAVIAKIEILGGKISKDESLPGKPVTAVNFQRGKRFNEKHLHLVTSFKSLKTLDLNGVKLTESGAEVISGIDSLLSLNLFNTDASDDALKQISKLSNLTKLDVGGRQITDIGVKEISNLKKLKKLSVKNTAMTDDGLRELCSIPELTILDLEGNKLTPAGITELTRLKRLSTLSLLNVRLTDRELKQLSELKQLKNLIFSESRTTESGLTELRQAIPKAIILREAPLIGTNPTDE